MEGKIILIKYPDNSYHTASVNRFVSVNINGKNIDTIWYIDINEADEDDTTGSYSIIRDNNDGTYTNLNCGDLSDYQRIYDEISKCVNDNKYTNKDVNSLPYSIDTVEDYDYQSDLFSEEEIIELSDEVKSVKKEISTRIGAFVDPYYLKSYKLMEKDLGVKLEVLKEKMTDSDWRLVKNELLSYLSFKKMDMSRGYILIEDASNALNEIEEIVLEEIKNKNKVIENKISTTEEIELPALASNKDISSKEIEENKLPELTIGDLKSETKEEMSINAYHPYIKTIYVLWNKVYSNLASFAYYEFNSYTNISNRIVLSFDNMGNKYNSINKEITRIIDKKPLKITEKNLLTVYDNQTKYNFYIIPVEDYDVFMTLRDSNTPYLFSKEIEEPLIALIKGVERKNIIVTEKQTLSILE